MLESPHIRDARRDLHRALVDKTFDGNWWDIAANDKLEGAASAVCASFDIVGVVAKRGNRKFFVKYWSNGICWTHESLQTYLDHRHRENPSAYSSYDDLYKEAKPFDRRKSSATAPRSHETSGRLTTTFQVISAIMAFVAAWFWQKSAGGAAPDMFLDNMQALQPW
jgi:hypothetical protein